MPHLHDHFLPGRLSAGRRVSSDFAHTTSFHRRASLPRPRIQLHSNRLKDNSPGGAPPGELDRNVNPNRWRLLLGADLEVGIQAIDPVCRLWEVGAVRRDELMHGRAVSAGAAVCASVTWRWSVLAMAGEAAKAATPAAVRIIFIFVMCTRIYENCILTASITNVDLRFASLESKIRNKLSPVYIN
jgi:hypothetical protein